MNLGNPGRDYEFAQLSDAEIEDLQKIEDKINREKPGEVVVIAYQKDRKS